MGLFGPKPVGTLKLGFPQRDEIQLLDDSILHTSSEPPAEILYPFMMAGKLFYHFGDPAAQAVAQTGAEELYRRLESDTGEALSLLGICSEGSPKWVAGGGARMTYRADFVRAQAPVLMPQTHFTSGDDNHYHRLAIDACFDLARARSSQEDKFVALSVAAFLTALALQGVPDPQTPVLLAFHAARQAAA